jgi:hypothetical protein
MFNDVKVMAPATSGGHHTVPIGRAVLEPAIELALCYSAGQGLLPRPLTLDELPWAPISAHYGTGQNQE